MATVEPTIYPPAGSVPWLQPAAELEALAQVALKGSWTVAQASRADMLVNELWALMQPPVTVPPEPIKPPAASADKYPKYPPSSDVVIRVPEDHPNVMAALQAAKPGETVSVADGFKCGELTLTKAFDPTKPVVLRARNQGRVELDKRVRIKAQGYWLHGFKQTYKQVNNDPDGGAILLEADYVSFTRMEIQSPHGITAPGTNRRGINIGWCLFSGMNPTGTACSNIYFHLPNGGSGKNASDLPRNIHIYRNDFHDNAKRTPGSHEDHIIYFGPSRPKGSDLLCMEDVEIYQNLIRKDNDRVREIYMKRGGRIIQNTVLGSGYNLGIRHGGDSLIEGNTLMGTAKLVINGPGTKIVGNLCRQIQLYAGSGPTPPYQAADRSFLDSNSGPVLVGYVAKQLSAAEGGKVGDVRIHNHTGKVTINEAGTERGAVKQEQRAQGQYLPRLALTPDDVGLMG